MKYTPLFLFVFVMTACGAMDQYSPLSTPEVKNQIALASNVPFATSTVTPTQTPNAVGTAMMVIEIDRATGTAEAASTSTSMAITATQEAKSTQAFWVAVTLDLATQQSIETRTMKTQTAGTAQAEWRTQQPPTQTALAATQIIERDQLNSRRASTWILNVGGTLILTALCGLLVYALYLYISFRQSLAKAEVSEKSHIKPDKEGRFPLLPEDILKGKKLINANLQYSPVLDPSAPDRLTNEQSLDNTTNARRLEMVRSVAASPAINRIASNLMKRPEGNKPAVPTVTITKPEPAAPQEPLPALPSLQPPHWKLLNKWDGHFLPYGVDEQSNLMLVDPAKRPHELIVGGTGSGKTRSAIRTIVTGALSTGWNVVILGKKVDYLPFEEHPNVTILAVDVRKDAQKYINVLRTLTAQMDVRDQLLSAARVSTWDRYGAPQTMVVLDDFTGAMMRMPDKKAAEVLNETKQIAMDGRKFGLNLVIGLQRATWTSIDTDLRSQMGRIVYRVESANDSRVALDESGAEKLPYLNFLTKLTDDSSIQRGVGFFLEDLEVEAFLASRPAPQNERMNWVDGVVKEEDPAVTSVTMSVPVSASTPSEETDKPMSASMMQARKKAEETIKIQNLYSSFLSSKQKFSLADIERAVFGDTGGSFHKSVKKAIADLEGVPMEEVADVIASYLEQWGTKPTAGETATTTENIAGMGVFGLNPQ